MGLETAALHTLLTATAVTVASAVDQRQQAKGVAKAAEDQADVERAVEAEGASRQRRAQASEALVRQREVENQAATVGFAGTAVDSAVASIQNQAAGNVGDINFAVQSADRVRTAKEDVFKESQQGLGSMLLQKAGGVAAGVVGTAVGNKLV